MNSNNGKWKRTFEWYVKRIYEILACRSHEKFFMFRRTFVTSVTCSFTPLGRRFKNSSPKKKMRGEVNSEAKQKEVRKIGLLSNSIEWY